MTHPRKLTRDAIKARVGGLELNGRELTPFVNRTQDFEPSELPAVSVLTPEETSERATKSGPLDRHLSVLVVVAIDASKADDVDDELDAWAELIEQVLKPTPVGAARRLTLTATSLDVPDVAEGDTWIGFVAMEYDAFIQDEQ